MFMSIPFRICEAVFHTMISAVFNLSHSNNGGSKELIKQFRFSQNLRNLRSFLNLYYSYSSDFLLCGVIERTYFCRR